MRFGRERRGDDVRVRVRVPAPHRAAVLQDEDVAEARVASQVAQAVAVRLAAGATICAGGKSAQVCACSGVSVTSSWAPIAFMTSNMPGAAPAELALDAEQRVLVGRDADPPAAAVLDARDLDGVQVLVARAERAGARRVRRRVPPAPGRQVARPLGGDDHPASEDRVASELGHCVVAGPASPSASRRVALRSDVARGSAPGRRILADVAARCGSGAPML